MAKVKKAQAGVTSKLGKRGTATVDTSGYSSGKKLFPYKVTSPKGEVTDTGRTTRGGAKMVMKKSKPKKAEVGMVAGRDERLARREMRQANRESRQADRQLKRNVCRGGMCGGRAKGYVGYKKGGKLSKSKK